MKVETGIPAIYEIVNTLSEEPLGLGAELFFNSSLDIIIACE